MENNKGHTHKVKVLCKDEDDVITKIISTLVESETKALNARGAFHIGVSGGSVVKYLKEGLSSDIGKGFDLAKWQVFFCDERFVDKKHPDSTYSQYLLHVVSCTSLKAEQFHHINMELPLAECAKEYEQDIRKCLKAEKPDEIPKFDLLLLGMGPDGHTCSLFPNHKLLKEDSVLIAPIEDSPKPPAERITMTFKLINNARQIVGVAVGKEKKDLLDNIVMDDERFPIGMVNPIDGEFNIFYS